MQDVGWISVAHPPIADNGGCATLIHPTIRPVCLSFLSALIKISINWGQGAIGANASITELMSLQLHSKDVNLKHFVYPFLVMQVALQSPVFKTPP